MKFRVFIRSGPWWKRNRTIAMVDSMDEVNKLVTGHSEKLLTQTPYRIVIDRLSAKVDELMEE